MIHRMMLKPVLPWLALALLAAGFGAGFTVSDWRDQGTIERLRVRIGRERAACERDKAAAERQARRFLKSENERLERQARRERARAGALLLRLRKLAVQAAKDREELAHALADSTLGRCDARGPARLLRDKAERYAREIARSGAHAGVTDGRAARSAGNARQGKRDGRDGLSVGGHAAGLGRGSRAPAGRAPEGGAGTRGRR